jgi:hypothetical protein
MWKGEMNLTSDGIGKFGSTANFDVRGNIMSLLYGDNFKGQTDLKGNGTFHQLFYQNTKILNAKNLSLPATKLTVSCYDGMFAFCENLITAPELPATTLTNSCYYGMFANCTNLISAPELPSTSLGEGCYSNMFANCTSLTIAPELPATTLKTSCYDRMFAVCTNLVTIPNKLPATELT